MAQGVRDTVVSIARKSLNLNGEISELLSTSAASTFALCASTSSEATVGKTANEEPLRRDIAP